MKIHCIKNFTVKIMVICDLSDIYHRFDALRRPILRVYTRSRGRTSGKCPFVAKAQYILDTPLLNHATYSILSPNLLPKVDAFP